MAGSGEGIDALPILDAPGGDMLSKSGVEDDLGIAARRGMGAR